MKGKPHSAVANHLVWELSEERRLQRQKGNGENKEEGATDQKEDLTELKKYQTWMYQDILVCSLFLSLCSYTFLFSRLLLTLQAFLEWHESITFLHRLLESTKETFNQVKLNRLRLEKRGVLV